MQNIKVVKSGNSQAVHLPRDFQLNSDGSETFSHDNESVIQEAPANLAKAFELLTQMPDDFFAEGREDAIS